MQVPSNGDDALLYVADTNNHRIQVFNARTGDHMRFVGNGKGAALGQLHLPRGIALRHPGPDNLTLAFVTEEHNHRMQIFSV